ncbi:MAG: hypothetical protein ACTSPO_15690 [Candidatus Heimdallarchaeaceae archaeon]
MTYTTSGAAVVKAGANVSTAIPEEEGWVKWISGAIGVINTATRKNWSDNFATLNDDVKYILHEAATNIVAINAIQYDMSGYTSRGEAESMINVLRDAMQRDIQLLKDIKQQTFLENA